MRLISDTLEEIKVNGIDRVSNSLVVATSVLPERHDPDGGEDGADLELPIPQPEESEEDHWSDWETEQVEEEPPATAVVPLVTSSLTIESSRQSAVKRTTIIDNDLSTLEIQIKSKEEEIDYFADMEPTITATTAVFVDQVEDAAATATTASNRLSFNVQVEEEDKDGWNWDDWGSVYQTGWITLHIESHIPLYTLKF